MDTIFAGIRARLMVGQSMELPRRFLDWEFRRCETDITLGSIPALVQREGLLKRALLVEFGDDEAAFEALVPDRYLYQGREVSWEDSGPSLN